MAIVSPQLPMSPLASGSPVVRVIVNPTSVAPAVNPASLDVVIVGTSVAASSAQRGHYYAGPGN